MLNKFLLLLGSSLLGSRLLCSRLFGSSLGLLSSRLLLGSLGLLSQLEAACSLAGLLGHLEGSLLDTRLECKSEVDSSLCGINLVVGADVLEDGLSGGASSVLQSGDGGTNHHGIGWVLSGLLGLGRGLLGSGFSSRDGGFGCVVSIPC